jgi:hypothetical protein
MIDAHTPRVFLGVPAVLSARQQEILEKWLVWLRQQGLGIVRLERSHYGTDPWTTLARLLASTEGVVLLGFGQLDTRRSTWRPGTIEEAPANDWWASSWLQVEAGMAVGLGLPVLAAPEHGVAEGAFHPDVWVGLVSGTPLTPAGTPDNSWIDAVRRRHDEARRASH